MRIIGWLRQNWIPWTLFIGFWTVIGLSFASQFFLASALFGYSTVTWGQAVSLTLGDWYVWAVLSLPVIWFARRFPLHRRNWAKLLVIHTAASLVVCIAYVFARAAVGQLQNPLLGMTTTFWGTVEILFLKNTFLNILIYWIIVSDSLAFDYYRKFRDRELRAAALERRLAEARLMALQMQLNPHFLFNALHTISALMHVDVEKADRTLARLSELLRFALENTDANEVRLRDELEFLRRYLEIEQTRFGERLGVRLDIPADTLDALVPNLILQPLVENAIRHGIEPHRKTGLVEIRARRDGGRLQLEVRDNGSGLPTDQAWSEGVGLANTRARLEHLYGRGQTFALTPAPEGGLVAGLTIPFRETPAVSAAAASCMAAARLPGAQR
jgi:signal transduction histidine kinase